MPGSSQQGKLIIKKWFEGKNIKTIVDVGCGSGTYPKLLGGEYKWIGVEIFPDYIERFGLKNIYSELIVEDIYTLAVEKPNLPKADCIIFGDVLEHLEREEAVAVLSKAVITYEHIVVSIPVVDNGWGKVHYGNEREKHVYNWNFEEFKSLVKWSLAVQDKDIGVFCL